MLSSYELKDRLYELSHVDTDDFNKISTLDSKKENAIRYRSLNGYYNYENYLNRYERYEEV